MISVRTAIVAHGLLAMRELRLAAARERRYCLQKIILVVAPHFGGDGRGKGTY
jgi:hypothetical protein